MNYIIYELYITLIHILYSISIYIYYILFLRISLYLCSPMPHWPATQALPIRGSTACNAEKGMQPLRVPKKPLKLDQVKKSRMKPHKSAKYIQAEAYKPKDILIVQTSRMKERKSSSFPVFCWPASSTPLARRMLWSQIWSFARN